MQLNQESLAASTSKVSYSAQFQEDQKTDLQKIKAAGHAQNTSPGKHSGGILNITSCHMLPRGCYSNSPPHRAHRALQHKTTSRPGGAVVSVGEAADYVAQVFLCLEELDK